MDREEDKEQDNLDLEDVSNTFKEPEQEPIKYVRQEVIKTTEDVGPTDDDLLPFPWMNSEELDRFLLDEQSSQHTGKAKSPLLKNVPF